MNRKNVLLAARVLALAALARTGTAADAPKEPFDGKHAFEMMKGLAGEWNGAAEAGKPGYAVRFALASAGTVVEEIQFPGTPHEMRSLYYMDGSELVLTHYCAVGNQPHMRLDRARSSGEELFFDFDGGTNVNPAKDTHVHSGRIHFVGADRIDAEWAVESEGKPAGSHKFVLTRSH